MVSKMTVARIPPAMTTVPADIRNPLHQQPAGRKKRKKRRKREEQAEGRGGPRPRKGKPRKEIKKSKGE